MENTIEVYAYICYGIAGAPPTELGMHVTGDQNDQPRKLDTWKANSYWALSTLGENGYPPVLMHVHFEGDMPDDRQRDRINHHVQRLTGELLFKQK